MVIGYAVAVIAGFLLTAVRNWTGIQTPDGRALAGRIAPFMAGTLPPWIIAAMDLALLPLLAVPLSPPLLRSRQIQRMDCTGGRDPDCRL